MFTYLTFFYANSFRYPSVLELFFEKNEADSPILLQSLQFGDESKCERKIYLF